MGVSKSGGGVSSGQSARAGAAFSGASQGVRSSGRRGGADLAKQKKAARETRPATGAPGAKKRTGTQRKG